MQQHQIALAQQTADLINQVTTTAQPNTKQANERSAHWCFTLNNPTTQDIEKVKAFFTEKCSYGHYQAERAPSTNTLHLQGFFALKTRSRVGLAYVKKNMVNEAHYEKMKGTLKSNLDYCSKTDTQCNEIEPFTFGQFSQPGVVQIKTNLTQALKECQTLQDFKETHPQLYCQYINGVTKLYTEKAQNQIRIPPLVVWFWGETGTGKTRTATTLCAKNNIPYWISSGKLKWFDGYTGQDVVIFDDFRKGDVEFQFLLRLLDLHRCNIEIKGSTVPFNPKVIIITNPQPPREHFQWTNDHGQKQDRENIVQLTRRIHHVIRFDSNLGNPNVWFIKDYLLNGYKEALQKVQDFIANFNLDEQPHMDPESVPQFQLDDTITEDIDQTISKLPNYLEVTHVQPFTEQLQPTQNRNEHLDHDIPPHEFSEEWSDPLSVPLKATIVHTQGQSEQRHNTQE